MNDAKYKTAKEERIKAENWNNLPNGQCYGCSTFAITQSKIILTRSGQRYCGDNNYWDTTKSFGKCLEEVIKEDSTIIKRVIDKLRQKENEELIKLESELTSLQEMIEKAKAEK